MNGMGNLHLILEDGICKQMWSILFVQTEPQLLCRFVCMLGEGRNIISRVLLTH